MEPPGQDLQLLTCSLSRCAALHSVSIVLVSIQICLRVYSQAACLATQASANTLMAHFAGLVFTNWLLRLVNEDAAPAKMSNPGKGSSGNTVFPKPA